MFVLYINSGTVKKAARNVHDAAVMGRYETKEEAKRKMKEYQEKFSGDNYDTYFIKESEE